MSRLIDFLEVPLATYDIEYRLHVTRRLFERQIGSEEVEAVLERGSIIERHDDDLPLHRLLLSGQTGRGRWLHVAVVVSLSEKRVTVLTTYEPDRRRWNEDFSRRRP